MARRRRSGLSGLWLQLTLQAALAVSAINAADAAHHTYAHATLLNAPSDDAFVFSGESVSQPGAPPSFEDFSLSFYLPAPANDHHDTYVAPSDIDAALLGGPEPHFMAHNDDFFLPM